MVTWNPWLNPYKDIPIWPIWPFLLSDPMVPRESIPERWHHPEMVRSENPENHESMESSISHIWCLGGFTIWSPEPLTLRYYPYYNASTLIILTCEHHRRSPSSTQDAPDGDTQITMIPCDSHLLRTLIPLYRIPECIDLYMVHTMVLQTTVAIHSNMLKWSNT